MRKNNQYVEKCKIVFTFSYQWVLDKINSNECLASFLLPSYEMNDNLVTSYDVRVTVLLSVRSKPEYKHFFVVIQYVSFIDVQLCDSFLSYNEASKSRTVIYPKVFFSVTKPPIAFKIYPLILYRYRPSLILTSASCDDCIVTVCFPVIARKSSGIKSTQRFTISDVI